MVPPPLVSTTETKFKAPILREYKRTFRLHKLAKELFFEMLRTYPESSYKLSQRGNREESQRKIMVMGKSSSILSSGKRGGG